MIFLGLNIVSGRWSICMDRASARFSFGSLLLVALDIATSRRASSKTLWYKTCLRLRKSLNSDSWLLYSVYDPSPPLCSCDTTGSSRPGRGKSTKALKLDEIKMGNIIIKIKYFSNSLNLIVSIIYKTIVVVQTKNIQTVFDYLFRVLYGLLCMTWPPNGFLRMREANLLVPIWVKYL